MRRACGRPQAVVRFNFASFKSFSQYVGNNTQYWVREAKATAQWQICWRCDVVRGAFRSVARTPPQRLQPRPTEPG